MVIPINPALTSFDMMRMYNFLGMILKMRVCSKSNVRIDSYACLINGAGHFGLWTESMGAQLFSPSTAYMRHLIVSALVQVMDCRLFGTKPLPEPMLAYCQMDP